MPEHETVQGFVGLTTVKSKFRRSYTIHVSNGQPNYFLKEITCQKLTRPLTSTNTLFNSIQATVLPKHLYFPCPKIKSTTLAFFANSSSLIPNHRSGQKNSGSCPKTSLSRTTDQVLLAISVPPGTNTPLIVSPSGGTTFGRRPPEGGLMRRPSWMTACRYGSWRASDSWTTGLEILPARTASSISACRRAYTRGEVMTWSIMARMAEAVVSEPPRLLSC